MKITCQQNDLAHGLSVVSHALSSKATLPILSNILIQTDGARLKLSATNLELGISYWCDAQIEEEGTTTIPAKTFSDLVSSLRAGSVHLEVSPETHVMHVVARGSNGTVKGMEPSEFPLIPGADGSETPVEMDAELLKEIINEVAFCAATDDSRPILTGVHTQVSREQLTCVAADSFRLAVRIVPQAASELDHLLIPARTLTELGRILPAEGRVQVIVTSNRNQVLFHTEQIDLVSRLLEGTFPNFRQILPKEYVTRAVVPTQELASAIRSIMPFASNSGNIARLLTAGEQEEGQHIQVEATAEDVGSNVSRIEASVSGPEQHVILNAKYVADVLKATHTPEIALEVESNARPVVLRPVGGAVSYIIMPLSNAR